MEAKAVGKRYDGWLNHKMLPGVGISCGCAVDRPKRNCLLCAMIADSEGWHEKKMLGIFLGKSSVTACPGNNER